MYRLKKALYNLKQALRVWYDKINGYFIKHRFYTSESKPALYVKNKRADEVLIVYIYIDDLIYTSGNSVLINEFIDLMIYEFEMTDLGLLSYFLGLGVK